MFTDPEFPPSSRSLFRSGTDKYDIVWKRPRVRIGKWEERGKDEKEGGREKERERGREKERERGRDGWRKGGGRVGDRDGWKEERG